MIALETFFDNFGSCIAPLCASDAGASDLARAADLAVSHGAGAISVDAASVGVVWPWLENTGVKIAARIQPPADDMDTDARVSMIARTIKSAFNNGADSAQIFVRSSHIGDFVDAIAPIRDDLFFNKKLALVLDLMEIESAA